MCNLHKCWFPKRKFIFLGDSTQSDPEAYGEIYRRHPTWVGKIFIRKVTGIAAAALAGISSQAGFGRDSEEAVMKQQLKLAGLAMLLSMYVMPHGVVGSVGPWLRRLMLRLRSRRAA